MNLEQRVCRLERQNRTLRRIVLGSAILVIVCISIGACQLVDEFDNLLVSGTLEVKGKVTTAAIELKDGQQTRRLDLDDLAALSRVELDAVSGGDPATDAVTTNSREFSDIPDLEIPFQHERDTVALAFFRSGEMNVPTGQLVTFSLGYERSLDGQFVELHRHALDENYRDFGADFTWVGTIPAHAVAVKMRWRVATGQPATIGVENGQPRTLVLVAFPPGGSSATPTR